MTQTMRVRYGETDQMGYVYYGDYAEYLEVGRVEALRSLGFPYRRLEEEGVMLPVHDLRITYHKPARYDDLLTIRTIIKALPSVRIVVRPMRSGTKPKNCSAKRPPPWCSWTAKPCVPCADPTN